MTLLKYPAKVQGETFILFSQSYLGHQFAPVIMMDVWSWVLTFDTECVLTLFPHSWSWASFSGHGSQVFWPGPLASLSISLSL